MALSDPRVVRSRQAVLDATVALLSDHGWSGTTIEAVAERSGVAKTTIYRHWPHRTRLILEAFESTLDDPRFEASDDLFADLVTLACSLADALEQSRWARTLPALLEGAERAPELAGLAAEVGRRQRAAFSQRLAGAVARGQLPEGTDVELMAHMLTDPLFVRRLMWRDRTPTRFIEALVDRVMRAFDPGS